MLELAIGTAVVLSLAVLFLAVYERVEAHVSTLRVARQMTEYVSRESQPTGAEIDAYARYLQREELPEHALVMKISGLHKEKDDDTDTVEWTDTVKVGDATKTAGIEGECAAKGASFSLTTGEHAVAVSVCARGTGLLAGWAGPLDYSYLMPSRDQKSRDRRPDAHRAGNPLRMRLGAGGGAGLADMVTVGSANTGPRPAAAGGPEGRHAAAGGDPRGQDAAETGPASARSTTCCSASR